jgi:hypothetical protein
MNCHITKKDNIKLVQLFNPWGMKEWTVSCCCRYCYSIVILLLFYCFHFAFVHHYQGDWSDDSDKWTPELLVEVTQQTKTQNTKQQQQQQQQQQQLTPTP